MLFKINTKKDLRQQSEKIANFFNDYQEGVDNDLLSPEEKRRKENLDSYMRKVHNLD